MFAVSDCCTASQTGEFAIDEKPLVLGVSGDVTACAATAGDSDDVDGAAIVAAGDDDTTG
jgi:hypothetical protein